MKDAPKGNPLLEPVGLPPFDRIHAEHVVPAITWLLARLEEDLEALEGRVEARWEDVVEEVDRITEPLGHAWGIAGHLLGVRNSDELRAAYEQVQPEVVRVMTRIGQSEPIYKAAKALLENGEAAGISGARHRILSDAVRDAELAGIGLEGDGRVRFNEIQAEQAKLSRNFSNNVLDATKAWSKNLTDPQDVEGLPGSLRQLMARSARDEGADGATADEGPWRITLDAPCVGPFLQHCRSRGLREEVYRAYISRAGSGKLDNRPVMRRTLELRAEKSRLLGFNNYAEVSLSRKMAGSVEQVERLLEDLRAAAYPAAERDLQELRDFARAQGAAEADDLRHWDMGFWAERLREERFRFTDEELRPYFPLDRVLEGLFSLANRLFGVHIRSADGEVAVWHPDVHYFHVQDDDGKDLATFYLDPYSRPADKRGGAWMDGCIGRSRVFAPEGSAVRLPCAYLVCNQTPPGDDRPSLMSFGEVETLFHEFGHGLQHMLTQVDLDRAAGIHGVEWDAVELPSQFMENWCYHKSTLLGFSGHYQTGESLPEELFEKLVAARNYRSGSGTLRQLYFAATDLALHRDPDPANGKEPEQVMHEVARHFSVLQPLPEDHFLCSFAHIFAGGYAAGYYSYKWAEVLSADAFMAFDEAGLDDQEQVAEVGRRFRDTVLALGGSVHPMEVFRRFRGREPSPDSLLVISGLKDGGRKAS